MTKKQTVKAGTSTHFPNPDKVTVEQSDAKLTNSQMGMLLIDPDDIDDEVSTHSDKELKFNGPRKAPVSAGAKRKTVKADAGSAQPLIAPKPVKPGNLNIPNDEDPAAGYLDDDGLPTINNEVTAESDFEEDELMLASEEDDEFGDLSEITAEGDDEFDDLGPVDPEVFDQDLAGDDEDALEDAGADQDVVADFENVEEGAEHVPLVDVDGVDDGIESDDLSFATIGAAVHVIHSNRIIASMGPAAATRADVKEAYLMEQFPEVVAATVAKKGLRKGLVQSGFVLSKVKLTSSKATAKVVSAKVEATVAAKMEQVHKRDAILEQCLAIAAVGINKQLFTSTPNPLKATLETELEQAGVRGASRIVRAAFASDGVAYAKEILTAAKKLAAMPEEVREGFVEALDMSSGDIESVDDVEMDDVDELEDMPTDVVTALSRPISASTGGLLRATNGNRAAYDILSGTRSLV